MNKGNTMSKTTTGKEMNTPEHSGSSVRVHRAGWSALGIAGGALVLGAVLFTTGQTAYASKQVYIIPPPTLDEPAAAPGDETAVIAGGCFWGVQGVFQHVRGVKQALSGYTGGSANNANYDMVSTGTTGHAEAVKVTYDPAVISYGELLQIYFSVAHDPTELNRQGPDRGTQYRSTIFVENPAQQKVAQAYIDQLDKAGVYPAPLATTIESFKAFYPAEDYHQDYLTLHPQSMYIMVNDQPKVDNLKKVFANYYQTSPALVK